MASGRPDWFGTIVAAGKYDTTFIPIGLDVDGFITATMKGAYDAALKTIAVDSSGIMKANLTVQDLDFLTVRPAYGEGVGATGLASATKNDTTIIKTVSGRGVILGGWFRWSDTVSRQAITITIEAEEVAVESFDAAALNDYQQYHHGANPLYLIKYDDVNFSYIVGISPKLTFETSFRLVVVNPYGSDQAIYYVLFYALVP